MQRGQIQAIIAVAAGKGGVGKSTVAVNLALALQHLGSRVGLLDADLYGPSLRMMLPEERGCLVDPEPPHRILPAQSRGIQLLSLAHFRDDAAVVRAPIVNQWIDKFTNGVNWGVLDYLLVDFPPGTGDIQLSLIQQMDFDGALIVTTPQRVAAIDVEKTMWMCMQLNVALLGIVENMSYFFDPASGLMHTPFGEGGGERLAEQFGVPLVGNIPIDPELCRCMDQGASIFDVQGSACSHFLALARKVQEAVRLHAEPYEWREGEAICGLTPGDLQRRCPCMRCKAAGRASVDPAVQIISISKVGNYAFRIQFSSGCSQGIYPFALVKTWQE